MSEAFICPLSKELMVDPVVAQDGVMCDRDMIEQWLQTHTTSPDSSKTLSIAVLQSIVALRVTIETMINSGNLDKDKCDAWRKKKRAFDLKRAQKLFDEGLVLEAATLKLPEAQGVMANRCYHGSHGLEKDLVWSLEYALLAARGGDMERRRRLGNACENGEVVKKDKAEAKKWYGLAGHQGCRVSMYRSGCLHSSSSGHGFLQDYQQALDWFHMAADLNCVDSIYRIGRSYYKGLGVAKDLVEARIWFQKASSRQMDCKFMFGFMVMRGEGGPKSLGEGMTLIEAAAADRGKQAC